MSITASDLDGFDFLKETNDDELLRHSAQNILDSYAHPWDILAETLQNSVDAIELKADTAKDFFKNIFIEVDAKRRAIEVSDSRLPGM